MKFSKILIGASLCLSGLFGAVQADNACNPCAANNPCDLCDIDFCNLEFDFFVDALYWQVCHANLDFDKGSNDIGYINPDWHWGYRLAGYARYNSWDMGLRYTSFCHSDKRSSGGDSKFTWDYDVLDIEFGHTCCLDCCPIAFRPMAGVKLAWIDDKFDKGDNNDGNEGKIDYCGYGLYLGFSARYDLCSYCVCDRNIPIAIVTRATTGILHSNFDYHLDNADNDSLEDECLYIPVQDLYVGLDLTFCDLCGMDAFMQVGYEVQNWSGWREHTNRDDTTNWGTGGLVLRFGASF